jgi:hypothetical protein
MPAGHPFALYDVMGSASVCVSEAAHGCNKGMRTKTVLITGIAGQDDAYHFEFLLKLGY